MHLAAFPAGWRGWSWALAALLAVAWPATARGEASSEDQARARQLFEEGVAAARGEDYEAAIAAFVESFDLYPHPGTLLNLGLYQMRAGRRVDAYSTLSALMTSYGGVISDRARGEVGQRLHELEAALALVTITTNPAGALVLVDEVELGRTPLDAPLAREPGPCSVEARLEGHQTATGTIELRAGERPTVALALDPILAEPPTLVVESQAAGARASIDGSAPEPLPLRRSLEPGDHELVVTAPGHVAQTRPVNLPETGEVRLDIALVPVPGGPEPPPPPRRRWPWVVGAVSAAAVIATAVALGVTLSDPVGDPDWDLRVR
jgi:hypothetical protein